MELPGIQGGEDVAQMIMGRRAIPERAKPAEQRQFLGPEQRDFGETFSPRQHGKQAEEQDLVERVDHLAGLARVLQITKVAQKS